MTARVLVVDDILANVKLLEARLQAEYFDVIPAHNGQDALDVLARERIDVVLLDVMMPGMDGFETCRRIKSHPATHHVPVVMVTALDQPADRVQGLEAGADDFLTKPVDDIALITRVKNLARVKMLNDEMMLRAATGRQFGMPDATMLEKIVNGRGGRILIVEDNPRQAARLLESLSKIHDAFIERDCQRALMSLTEHNFDVVIVSLSLAGADGLRLCSQLRSIDRTRHMPIIVMIDQGDDARLLRGLDLGVNDYLVRPIDRHELLARVRTQIRRRRHADLLRTSLVETVEMAVTDALTGLHNRRYMEGHLKTLLAEAKRSNRPFSLLVTDIDFFKKVNDTHGHDGGDIVLKEFARRLKQSTRGIDLACRLGGEEFVMIMPETDLARAWQIGERLRTSIASEPFVINRDTHIDVTASVGLATLEKPEDTPASIFKRADTALYAAKKRGRNQVVADTAIAA